MKRDLEAVTMNDDEKKILLRRILRDCAIIALGIVGMVFLEKTGVVEAFLLATSGLFPLVSFAAGIFFTSIFTVSIATVIFAEIARDHSLALTALCGGVGALVGDYIIFWFVRDTLLEELHGLLRLSGAERFSEIFRKSLFRYMAPFVGAAIIASPLPDELGVALLGLSNMSKSSFAVFSFTLNTFGIFVIGAVGRAIL